jgi:hypothetical protein
VLHYKAWCADFIQQMSTQYPSGTIARSNLSSSMAGH